MKKLALVCFMIFAALGGAFAQSDLQPLAIVKLNKSEKSIDNTLTRIKQKARAL